MTVTDSRPPTGSSSPSTRAKDSPRRASRTPLSAPPANRKPKPAPDVVDWLLMNALESPPAPPISGTSDGGDLLDAIVADHLTRAAEPSATSSTIDTPTEASIPADDDAGSGLLQKEIDALLAVDPAPAPATDAITAPTDAAVLTADELDTLLAPNAPTTSATAATAQDDGESRLLEAEDVLARELEALMADQTATPSPAVEPAPTIATNDPASPAPVAAGSDPLPAPQAAAPLIESFPTDAIAASPAPQKSLPPTRFARLFSDAALVAAQIADMPFQWMDVMDKNLLGVAALIMLLSGLALKAAAWWMGVH